MSRRPTKLYIERKTRNGVSLGHRGPAVIGEVTYSKTGKTIYYKGMKFKSCNGQGIYGNYYLVTAEEHGDADSKWEPADEFWITGVKKDGSNRYPGFSRHKVIENGDLD